MLSLWSLGKSHLLSDGLYPFPSNTEFIFLMDLILLSTRCAALREVVGEREGQNGGLRVHLSPLKGLWLLYNHFLTLGF